jgi:hypothetical protein
MNVFNAEVGMLAEAAAGAASQASVLHFQIGERTASPENQDEAEIKFREK